MTTALGSVAPGFALPNTDGGVSSLDALADAPVVVVAFWCNHCPYVRAWEERFNQIAREYLDRGVATVAICANDADAYPGDSFEAMTERAAEQRYVFAYAQDAGQDVARAYGAERTPEVYVLDEERRIRYHGAIDDDRDAGAVRQAWLRDALDAVLGGSAPATAETPAVGCTIKWRR